MRRLGVVALVLLAGSVCPALGQVVPLPKPAAPAIAIEADQQKNRERLARKLIELEECQSEIDRLRAATGTPSQVLVKLNLVELSLTKLKALGLVANAGTPQGVAAATPLDPILSLSTRPLEALEFGPELAALLDTLEKEQIARRLASCSLIAASGSPAAFHQGLEVPQMKKENGNQWIEYRQLGMVGDATALALGGERVRIDLRFRCPRSGQVGASQAPGQPILDVNTHVETQFGKTVVAQAARSDRREVEKRVVRGLGEIPLIGSAFARTREIKEELLTLLLVTPESMLTPGAAGTVATATTVPERERQQNQALLASKLDELDALRQEVDCLRHACRQGQQVVFKLRMIDVSRSTLKELANQGSEQKTALIERLLGGQLIGASVDAEDVAVMLEHLRRGITGIAEPNLAAYVGRAARFNSGGEFPIVDRQQISTTTVQYKKFGTEVDLTPIALASGRAQLQLRCRVSDIDESGAVEFKGVTMPGLRVREVQTEVDAPLRRTTIIYAAPSDGVAKTERREGNRVVHGIKHDEIITLLLVTPESVDAPAPPKEPTARAAPSAPEPLGAAAPGGPPNVPTARAVPSAPKPPPISAPGGPPIAIECRVVEIDIAKMRAAGFEVTPALMKSVGTSSPAAQGMIAALEREGIAQVVTRPQLMTLAGQPAEVRIVREVDVPVPGEAGKIGKDFVGTQFWVLPCIDEQGRITMELKLRTSEQGEPYPYKIENQPVFLVGGETTETTVTLEDGQTLLTGGGCTSDVMKSKDYEKSQKAAAPEDGLPSSGVARFQLLTARIVRASSAKEPTARGTGTIDPPPPPREARGLSSPTGAPPK